jgi:hypothetical protein
MCNRALIFALSAAALATGCPGGDVQVVQVTTPPTAEILSPGDASVAHEAGSLISFEGVVQDQQDSPDRLTSSWSSDRDGLLDEAVPDSTGRVSFATVDLSAGTHVISLQVVDTDGEVGEDWVSLEVERFNTEPEVEIDFPGNGDILTQGEASVFTAVTADADAEDPPDTLDVEWSSDVDGFLGDDSADAAGSLSLSTSSLSLGDHVVSVVVTDSAGASASDQVYVVVEEPNAAPTAMISDPLSGDIALQSAVTFLGEVGDDADRADTLGIIWESSLDGVINWDPASSVGMLGFSTSSLSVGEHTVTLSATDSATQVGSDSVTFTVVGADDWDADGDGWTPNEGDCDDGDASTNPGATESCDDIDNDCDGEINEDQGDGYEPNDTTPTDLGHMDGDGYCLYVVGYVSGSADTQTISANVHSPDDVDVYSFSTTDDWYDCLDESGYGIQIALTNVPAGHDYALDLYWIDGGGALVSSSDTAYNANEYVNFEGSYGATSDGDDGGEFEIVVSPSSGSGYGCSSNYSLSVEVW